MTENQETSEDKFTVLDVDGWNQRWKDRKIEFHKDHIHPMLEKHVDKLINNRENLRIFFPMCGKSLDMKWLADKGHVVTGVECSEMALEEFFEEQGLEYLTEPVEKLNGKVFKSKDGKISLYCCDIYMFDKELEGQFNAIWDRGGFVAINRQDRKKYTTLIKSLMAPDCRYLLSTFDYNEQLYGGPPHFIPVEQIQELYGDRCNIELVEIVDVFEEKHKGWGVDYLNERIHLLTLKNS